MVRRILTRNRLQWAALVATMASVQGELAELRLRGFTYDTPKPEEIVMRPSGGV